MLAARLLIANALVAFQAVLALPTIEIKGSKFFTSDGDQFYIKGVAYSVGASDVNALMNADQCEIDAKLIGNLGANVIRVYSIDPTQNHDACMKSFEDNGIYVIVDMSTPKVSINRADPQWTKTLRDAFAQVLDGFHKYDNLLAIFAGNELINDASSSKAAPYAKAVVADMKAYRDLMQYRQIPIGYSAADIASIRDEQLDYFDCGDNKTAVDFYAMNYYAWCGDSSFTKSGYSDLYAKAEGLDVPIFFSETGCNTAGSRTWEDQVAMLGREMNDRYSGNIIYEWSFKENEYGIVSYSNSAATGTPSIMPDYTRLKSQWATLSPAGVKASAYDPTLTKRDCPSFTSSRWLVQKDATLPTLGLDGFTTPTTRRTSTGSVTDTSRDAANTSKQSNSSSLTPNGSDGSSSTPVGAIAGGVVGGIVILGLVVGALFYLRRRKRKQSAEGQGESSNGGPHNPASDKMVVSNEEEKVRQHGFYAPNLQELSGQDARQELDPARGQIAPLPANELPLQHEGVGNSEANASYHHEQQTPGAVSGATPAEPSPFVQAQRNIEVEWLESEEARLRQRRELLMKQNG